tara:strand:- start:10645 stop:11418 length:774 start_codon:yes stop_codon:yes gene_type:complete
LNNITAIYNGKKISDIPDDLFIPPEHLRVILQDFEGPLDLLLYLIKKQNIDITDLPIFPITEQYMSYITVMEEMHFELASDYLVMASTLTEIKSKLLLPVEIEDNEEEDPRANLIKRLLEYQKYKNVSERLEDEPRNYRDFYVVTNAIDINQSKTVELPDIKIEQLKQAFVDVLKRVEIFSSHNIQAEALSVRERMSSILSALKDCDNIEFVKLFDIKEGRLGVIVTFLALLELVKESLTDVIQNQPLSTLYIGLKR